MVRRAAKNHFPVEVPSWHTCQPHKHKNEVIIDHITSRAELNATQIDFSIQLT